VEAGRNILRACGLEENFVDVVSCPTCGRCNYDCIGLAARVTERVKCVRKKLKVAVMGCVVNGPGEARGCDLGIAGGKEYCVIMERGKENERVSVEDAERVFFARLEELLKNE
ncbi:MAG: flavodoxin-dependent (E)-4-hydroxy-3-methylbut-2-enyl-diphosphate synthase, partial [Clostridia bacterium]|nr:flavodoxin-dependent (E)-4-hydroxy-3-methylbut-2-enyl-diphosphate synthase [Clostridia bacterium]